MLCAVRGVSLRVGVVVGAVWAGVLPMLSSSFPSANFVLILPECSGQANAQKATENHRKSQGGRL